MTAILIRDHDLHAYLLAPEVQRTATWIGHALFAAMAPAHRINSLTLLHHMRQEDPELPSTRKEMDAVRRTCPPNLAERMIEAMGIYRAFGWACLPPLLSLARHLMQAELHLYTSLKGGKPYRDHLCHQTRVAALAHLFLGKSRSVSLPSALSWKTIRRTWSRTQEFHLLHAHALACGIDCPDPGARDKTPWDDAVPAAALLAGLIHDMGYVQKSLGEISETVAATFPDLTFPPQDRIPRDLENLPLAGFYHRAVSAVEQGQRYASLGSYLSRSYRSLHSLVGALWLAALPETLDGCLGRNEKTVPEDGWFDLTVQLAAMMAFGHDLALTSPEKRARLGLRQKVGNRDILNLDDFPICTLFALCDVLQEFGRPVRVTGADLEGIRFTVPLAGLRMELKEPGERTEKQGRDLGKEARLRLETAAALWGLGHLSPSDTASLYISYISRDSKAVLLNQEALALRRCSDWLETEVAREQEEWLKSAGLYPHVRLDGAQGAAARIKDRFVALKKILDRGNPNPSEQRIVSGTLRQLGTLLAPGDSRRRRPNTLNQWVESLFEPESPYLPKIAPLADLGAGDGEYIAHARMTLIPPSKG